MDEVVCEVYRSFDYEKFVDLRGNRDDAEKRAKKIVESINDVGFIINPIIVNKKYEIVDGQARTIALKSLGLPIYYIVDDDIGFKECIAMNSNQTNWKLMDYISGYSEVGNDDYVRFKILCDEYLKDFGISVVRDSVTRSFRYRSHLIKSGKLECSHQQFIHAREMLEFDRKMKPYIDKVTGGAKEFYYRSLHFCFECEKIDNDLLLEKMKAGYTFLSPAAQLYQALAALEKIYNRRNRNPVFIETEYKANAINNQKNAYKKRGK